jgi:hypothetical protein
VVRAPPSTPSRLRRYPPSGLCAGTTGDVVEVTATVSRLTWQLSAVGQPIATLSEPLVSVTGTVTVDQLSQSAVGGRVAEPGVPPFTEVETVRGEPPPLA